jgi:Tol biopolymer transport system component
MSIFSTAEARRSPATSAATRVALAAAALFSVTACADAPTSTASVSGAAAAPSLAGKKAARIAFDAYTPAAGAHQVYTINSDGTNQVRVPKDSSYNYAAAWSPDRQHIAFMSNRSGFFELHVMDADGKNVRQVTSFASASISLTGASWSPDGTTIAFSATIVPTGEIFVVPADGSAPPKRLTNDVATDRDPVFSPSGTKIAFASNRSGSFNIHEMNTDGTNIVQYSRCTQACLTPSYSPDGTKVSYAEGVGQGPFTLRLQSAPMTVPQSLATNLTDNGRPRWSPDGTQIAYVAFDAAAQRDIYVVPSAGGASVRITNSPASEQFLSWAQ